MSQIHLFNPSAGYSQHFTVFKPNMIHLRRLCCYGRLLISRSNFNVIAENKSIKSAVMKSSRGFLPLYSLLWVSLFSCFLPAPFHLLTLLFLTWSCFPDLFLLLLLFPAPLLLRLSSGTLSKQITCYNLAGSRATTGRCNSNSFIPGLFLESKPSREGHRALRLSLFNFRGVPRNQLFWIIEEEAQWCRGIPCGKENWKSKLSSELQIKT